MFLYVLKHVQLCWRFKHLSEWIVITNISGLTVVAFDCRHDQRLCDVLIELSRGLFSTEHTVWNTLRSEHKALRYWSVKIDWSWTHRSWSSWFELRHHPADGWPVCRLSSRAAPALNSQTPLWNHIISPLLLGLGISLKGTVHPKMNILSLITHPHVVQNP